jgi:hypothetical protein
MCEKTTRRGDAPERWIDRDVTSAFRSVERRVEEAFLFREKRSRSHLEDSKLTGGNLTTDPRSLTHRITPTADFRRAFQRRASVRFVASAKNAFDQITDPL